MNLKSRKEVKALADIGVPQKEVTFEPLPAEVPVEQPVPATVPEKVPA